MPKILMLTNRIPYPLKDGGSLAMHYFIEGYIEAGVTLSLLAMQTTRHFVAEEKLPRIYQQLHTFKTVLVDNAIKPIDAFCNLFSKKSYNISRFESTAYEAALIEMLQAETYDFIQLESLFLTPYVATIRKYSKAKIILRSHNIEYKIWERLTAQTTQPLKKWYLNLLTKRLRRYEMEHLHDYDIILPISDQDKAFYLSEQVKAALYTISFGIKVKTIAAANKLDIHAQPMKIYHLGAMDWLPNIEGVSWLVKEVMPLIRQANLNIQLHLAGRNMGQETRNLAATDIIIDGEVEDAYAYESDKHLLCVPLLSGGGVRIKIFEALAQGKAIVTTTIGAEGMHVKHQQELFIAADAAAFARHIIYLYHHRSIISQIGQAGQALIHREYNRTQQIDALLAFLKQQ